MNEKTKILETMTISLSEQKTSIYKAGSLVNRSMLAFTGTNE